VKGRAKVSARRRAVGPLQQYHDRRATDEATAPLVNEFAARHGDYQPAAQTGEMRKAMRNRGGSTLDRWQANGLLSDSQLAAILHMQRLWRLVENGPRLVANLDRNVFGCPGDGHLAEIEARDALDRIRRGFPYPYWDVFERVCRWDEPAGTAGSRLANVSRAANEAARLTVCLIADMIYLRERLSY
jgi:hypothetical protein